MLCVIANYRTGSTTLCHEFVAQLGHEPMDGKQFEIFLNRQYAPPPNMPVIKIMPNQVKDWDQFERDYAPHITEYVYCVRRDVYAQALSFYISKELAQWHPPSVCSHNPYSDRTHRVKYNKGRFHKAYHMIKQNYLQQQKLYQQYAGTVIYLEDRIQQPYAVKHNINVMPPKHIVDFEVTL
jgi:LPS sulfotransferase NodH